MKKHFYNILNCVLFGSLLLCIVTVIYNWKEINQIINFIR